MRNINQLIISKSNFVAPAGRIFIALIFVMSGLNKINNYNNTAGWMEAMGVSGNLLPIVIALEVLGGAAIMIAGKRLRRFSLLVPVSRLRSFSMPTSQIKTK